MKIHLPFFFIITLLAATKSFAQDNYEIQVYGAETVAAKATMVELHSNYTFEGQAAEQNGVLPTHHVFHETVEITHGWNSWFETGFYFFNAIGNDNRTSYVGSHIRPRIAVPKKCKLPVGLSLSAEFGYQKPQYSEDDWTVEIRPIIDKQIGNLYLSFNPTFDKSLHGLNQHQGFDFAPNFKASYNISKEVAIGPEYYGALGKITHFDSYQNQQQQLFAVADLNVSEKWEINFGYGWGFTRSTDNGIFKLIVGYRFN